METPSDTAAFVLSIEIGEDSVSVSYVSSLLRIVQAALREVALDTDGAREHFESRPQPLLAMPALAGGDSITMSFVFVDPQDGNSMEEVSAATFDSFLDRLQAYVTSLPQPSLWGGALRRAAAGSRHRGRPTHGPGVRRAPARVEGDVAARRRARWSSRATGWRSGSAVPLDFVDTAAQIEGMADELRSRREVREHRLRNALDVMRDFPLEAYEERRRRGDFGWDAPEVKEPPAAVHGLPEAPYDHAVAAVDGSHIDVDRHLAARCFLINTGSVALTYGSRSRTWSWRAGRGSMPGRTRWSYATPAAGPTRGSRGPCWAQSARRRRC